MASVECANESSYSLPGGESPHASSDPVAKLRSRVFLGFGGSMALGLSLAGWYVGQRILVAQQTAPVPSATAIVTVAQQASAVVAPAQPTQTPASGPAPQKFLEVAGLGAKQDARFIRKLESKGLRARIDVDAQTNIRCILIGPFSDREALETAQDKLDSLGILALERSY